MAGRLYVVATPIGNLADITLRALEVLRTADLIAAEDTRHARKLLSHHRIEKPLLAYHEHNEAVQSEKLIARLRAGETVALISDAGTPLISDPGYRLVQRAREVGIEISPIPGPNAAVAALSVSGLPSDRFVFEGFLPRSPKARRERLRKLLPEERTLIFYESSHRILDLLRDLKEIFPKERLLMVAKELTKLHERFLFGPIAEVVVWAERDADLPKGEFVVLLEGACGEEAVLKEEVVEALSRLLHHLPLKEAVSIAAGLSGLPRRTLYQEALKRRDSADRR